MSCTGFCRHERLKHRLLTEITGEQIREDADEALSRAQIDELVNQAKAALAAMNAPVIAVPEVRH